MRQLRKAHSLPRKTYPHIFYPLIVQYGWDNIKHEILFSNLTQQEAREKEISLIIEAQERGIAINKQRGGYNAIYKEKMHEIVGLRRMGLSYKQIGEIYNVNASTISEILYSKRYLKDYTKEDFEKKVSDFVNRNRGKYVRRDGRTFSKLGVYSKIIVKKDKEGNIVDEYQSIVEAAKTNRILHTSIVNNLKGRSKTCRGFIYEYKQN